MCGMLANSTSRIYPHYPHSLLNDEEANVCNF